MSAASDRLHDRDLRQREIVPRERLEKCHALVIGVGAIGRQVATQLASLGISRMLLIDPDTVNVENLAVQGYWPTDLGQPKVEATKSICAHVSPEVQITRHFGRFRPTLLRQVELGTQIAGFVCVDSIAARRYSWQSIARQTAFYVDGRMSAEVLRVLSVPHPAMDNQYERTFFDPNQAYVGSCTAKSTIYTASIAAGLMIGQFTKWLRGMPVDADVSLNLLSLELNVLDASVT